MANCLRFGLYLYKNFLSNLLLISVYFQQVLHVNNRLPDSCTSLLPLNLIL